MHTLILISLVAGLYIFLRAVLPLQMKWWWKAALGLLILMGVSCFEGLKFLGGGRIFAPDLPAWCILSYTGLYMSLMAYFLLVLAAQAVRWCMLLIPAWRKQSREQRRTYFNRVHAALLVVAITLCGIGMRNALAMPEAHYITCPAKAPLRIAMLCDLHADAVKGPEFIRGIVERTNSLHPDIVVLVGDCVDGTVAQRGENLAPLRELKAPLGVYGVPGNHDYFSGYHEWQGYLSSLGIRMLYNEHVQLEDGIVLAGVADPAARHFGYEGPNVDKALAGAAPEDDIVLLAHQPQVGRQATKRVLLQLSGHTHGGLMPGFAELTALYNCGWVSGLYEPDAPEAPQYLYVSNGTSLWTGMPLRLFVPSEITIITLQPASNCKH